MPTPSALEARARLHELTVIDVRTPGGYAGGHLPGAPNIPLDRIQRALPDIRHAADRGGVDLIPGSPQRLRLLVAGKALDRAHMPHAAEFRAEKCCVRVHSNS